jgi:S1-C subfamily serine protease
MRSALRALSFSGKMQIIGCVVGAAVIAAALLGAVRADETVPPPPLNGPPVRAVVNCYDAARDGVARVLVGECHGKVISDDEAQAIIEKRESRLKQALGRRAPGSRDGLHLVSLGTGFYADDRGRLLTNNHVIDGCGEVTVRADMASDTDPGRDHEIPAHVVAVDMALDLAILQADSQTGATAEFPAAGTMLADTSVAIVGFPDQGLPPLEPLATPGMVLQRSANIAGYEHIVIRADLRHGNSGGPIFDRQGRVIGLVNAKLNSAAYFSATGLTLTDIGLGIPGRAVIEFLRRNDATYEESQGGENLTIAQILQRARSFVVRTECWK